MAISMKDVILSATIHNQSKAFVYQMERDDFLKMITRHEDKLVCQQMYF